MSDNTNKIDDKLDEFKRLNEKFYELFGRLNENKSLFNNVKAVEFFGNKIFEQYKTEYEILKVRFEEIEKPELYRERVKREILVPRRRFIFFRNRARKLIDNEIVTEFNKYFNDREKALEKQIKALERLSKVLEEADSAEHRTTAFDEPSEELEKQFELNLNDVEPEKGANDGAQLSTIGEPKESANSTDQSGAEPSEGENVQTEGEPKKKRKREKRQSVELKTTEQDSDNSNDGQLPGQLSIVELNQKDKPISGNTDKPE